jgi:hypothetical protein
MLRRLVCFELAATVARLESYRKPVGFIEKEGKKLTKHTSGRSRLMGKNQERMDEVVS